jgi:protein O-mannosyl-transferase
MAKSRLRKKDAPGLAENLATALVTMVKSMGATWRAWLPQALLIAGITLWIYGPALRGDFIWDDAWYISTNPLLHDSTGLWKFWFQAGSWFEFYPIEETVMWLQWQLWGNDTLGYHLTNVVLHIVSALLIWRLLGKLGVRMAWLGGLLFAVHPANVESVAWMVELKNTLSLPPFLLAMCAWIDYEERKERRDYLLALGLFLVAMLCKITMAPFPMVILLYAWWKRGRIGWSDVKASAPFLVISVLLIEATLGVGRLYGQGIQQGPSEYLPFGGWLTRITLTGLSIAFYFANCLVPVQLEMIHPAWVVDPPSPLQFLPWLALLAIIAWLWAKRKSWGRHAFLGLSFFLINLVPYLAFGVTYFPRDSWVMNHFLYIPMIGLIGVAVAAIGSVQQRVPKAGRLACTAGITMAVVLLAYGAHAYAAAFTNEETLWSYNLERNPDSSLAEHSLGSYYLGKNRFPEAIAHFREAIRLKPDFDLAYYNLGYVLEKTGHPEEAQELYRKALTFNPGSVNAYLNLGEMLRRNGKGAEAESLFRQGLKAVPGNPALTIDLAGLLIPSGRAAEALDLYEKAVELHPVVAQLQYSLGIALLQTGNLPEAGEHLAAAVQLDSGMASAHENLGVVLAQMGHLPEAIAQFQAAVAIDEGYVIARNNLAMALVQTGQIPEAIDQFQQVLKIKPDNAQAKAALAKLQQYSMPAGMAPR